ncbi:histone-lysine N-methyltransferase PRDM9-like [Penaeus indicus]|uniref:histone-lysine N-methyltransferase PRDM9-like n=1 Tax=Penaeus indicus TaxID=29960 RepID=UPI00300C7632
MGVWFAHAHITAGGAHAANEDMGQVMRKISSGTCTTRSLSGLGSVPVGDWPRHNWGCYERLRGPFSPSRDVGRSSKTVTECNWVRFLCVCAQYTPQVNMVATLTTHTVITFTVTRTLPPGSDIIAYLFHPEDLNSTGLYASLAPYTGQHTLLGDPSASARRTFGTQDLAPWHSAEAPPPVELSGASRLMVATSLQRRAVEALIDDEPLDLSQLLVVGRAQSADSDERRSVSSESSLSSCGTSESSQASAGDPSSGRLTDPFTLQETFGRSFDVGTPYEVPVPRRPRERSLLPCHICGKIFDRPSLLKRHMRTHTGEKPHICEVCGKGFSTSSSLNTHRRIHSGEKPHQCGTCGKRFTASSNLYYHKMTHIKDKPHKCGVCGRSFPTPGDLRCHTFVHTGQWPHRCPVCSKGFSKLTNLRNHLLLHSGKWGVVVNGVKTGDTGSTNNAALTHAMLKLDVENMKKSTFEALQNKRHDIILKRAQ